MFVSSLKRRFECTPDGSSRPIATLRGCPAIQSHGKSARRYIRRGARPGRGTQNKQSPPRHSPGRAFIVLRGRGARVRCLPEHRRERAADRGRRIAAEVVVQIGALLNTFVRDIDEVRDRLAVLDDQRGGNEQGEGRACDDSLAAAEMLGGMLSGILVRHFNAPYTSACVPWLPTRRLPGLQKQGQRNPG